MKQSRTWVICILLTGLILSACAASASLAPVPTIEIETAIPSTVTPSSTVRVEFNLDRQIGRGVIYNIAWSPTEDVIAVATPLGVRLHDPATLADIGFLTTSAPVYALLYLQDGRLIYSDAPGRIVLRQPGQMSSAVLQGAGEVCYMVLSPDEHYLATAPCEEKMYGVQPVQVWDLRSLELLNTFETKAYALKGFFFSPQTDALEIVDQAGADCLWNLASGQQTPPCEDPIVDGYFTRTKIIATRDSSRIALIGGYGYLGDRAWDETEYRHLRVGSGDMEEGLDLAYSPSGAKLVGGVNDAGVIITFDGTDFNRVWFEGPVTNMAFSPDEARFAAVRDFGELVVLDANTGEILVETDAYSGSVSVLTVSDWEDLLAAGYASGGILLWDLWRSDALFRTDRDGFSIAQLEILGRGLEVIYGGDGRVYPEYQLDSESAGIITFQDDTYRTFTEQNLKGPGNHGRNDLAVWAGSILVMARADGSVDILDAATLEPIASFQAQGAAITALEVTGVGAEYQIITGGADGLINFWSVFIPEYQNPN